MKYYSLNKKAPDTSFKDAVIRGLAPDNGLYFPKKIEHLPETFISNLKKLPNTEIAYKVIQQFIGDEITKQSLTQIIEETLSFDFPVVQLNEKISTLELFHGPTMAFKDVGARFMARCLNYFNQFNEEKVTVLVATSGDTGSAVANGFLNVEGVDVVILYPSEKVSEIQEKQLTTLDNNITALEVEGVFDDCQDMVKRAFVDEEIIHQMKITSANSINIARWLPQMFYYFFAYKQLNNHNKKIACSVPSGNFGNICAGLLAQKLGLPIDHFIAATNCNDVVPNFFKSKRYTPQKSKKTISNAMDVGNPSNFVRILELFDNDFDKLAKTLSSYSFSDELTKETIKQLYTDYQYIADPHGAVGYLGLKKYLDQNNNSKGIFLETAHPVKFLDVVEPVIKTKIDLPEQIKQVIDKEKKSIKIKTYEELKQLLLIN